MKQARRRDNDGLNFSRTQLYLILGSVLVVTVISFSLGHLISREKATEKAEGEKLENPALPEAEVLEEMARLEKRLKVAEKSEDERTAPVASNEPALEEEPAPVKEISFDEKTADEEETPPAEGVRVKTVEKVERKPVRPLLHKNTEVKLRKPPAVKPVASKPAVAPLQAEPELETETVSRAVIPPLPPEEAKPAVKKPASKAVARKKTAVAADPKYTVQVASFPSESKAKSLQRELKGKGYYAYLSKRAGARAVWYRVRVGAFGEKWEAEKVREQLAKSEGLEGDVISYGRK